MSQSLDWVCSAEMPLSLSMAKLMSNILFKYGQPDPDDDEPPADSAGPLPSPAGPSSRIGSRSSRRPAEVKFIDFQGGDSIENNLARVLA